MPHRPNEITLKWIESKYARKTNRAVQIKIKCTSLAGVPEVLCPYVEPCAFLGVGGS